MVSTLAFEASISGSNPEGTYTFFFAILRLRELFLFLFLFFLVPNEVGDSSEGKANLELKPCLLEFVLIELDLFFLPLVLVAFLFLFLPDVDADDEKSNTSELLLEGVPADVSIVPQQWFSSGQ